MSTESRSWEGTEPDYLLNLPLLNLRARDLLGLSCLRGGGQPPEGLERAEPAWEQIKTHLDTPVRLTSTIDHMGGPHQYPRSETPYLRRLDLHVLQRMSLVPGDIRAARDLLRRLPDAIPDLKGICVFDEPTDKWPNWPEASVTAYLQGLQVAVPPRQAPEDMQRIKKLSVAELEAAEIIYLRPHHMLCILCVYGNGLNEPLAVDNLWEILQRMIENPEIPVHLVEGDCMVCPPCHSFDPLSGACVAGCGLRDRRKDLDTMQLLDVLPGETYTARELLDRYHRLIHDTGQTCDYGDGNIAEWKPCGTARTGAYTRGMKRLEETPLLKD
jgi:hypothetical protein